MTRLIECPYCFENTPGEAVLCGKCNNSLTAQATEEAIDPTSEKTYQLYQGQSDDPPGALELYPPFSANYGYQSPGMNAVVSKKSSARLIIGVVAAVTVIALSVTALYLLYFQEEQVTASGEISHVVIDNISDQERNGRGSLVFIEVPDDPEPELPPEPIPVATTPPQPPDQTPALPPAQEPKPSPPAPSVVEPDEPDAPDETDYKPVTISITWNDGQYVGELKNDVPHGHGSWVHFTGKTYTGEFREGSITGYGNMVFPGGEVYTGYFKDGLAHGLGTMSHPDGRTVSGNWIEGIYQGD